MPRAATPKPRKRKSRGNGRGTVWESPARSGRWRWQITLGYTPDGKRISASGSASSKGLAERSLAAAIADHARGQFAAPDRVTFGEFAARWLKHQRHLAAGTRERYTRHLEYLNAAGLRDVPLQRLKRDKLKDVLSDLSDRVMKGGLGAGRPMSSATLATCRTLLRAVMREALYDEVISRNPAERVKRVKPLETEHPGVALEPEQLERFRAVGVALHAAGKCRLWPALFLCASLGLRRGEVLALEWRHVNLETRTLHIRQGLTVNAETGALEVGPLKTRHSEGNVPLTPSVVSSLRAHREACEARASALGTVLRASDPVFMTDSGSWTHPDNLSRALALVLGWCDPSGKTRASGKGKPRDPSTDSSLERRLIGIPRAHRDALQSVTLAGEALPQISPHDLRHTAGDTMLRRGMDIGVVSRILRHANISITYNVYRHVLESEIRGAIVDLFPEAA
jgi:integrase